MCRKAHLPALLLMALLSGLSAHADVVINETTFPDANFRNYILSRSQGADGVLTDAEIASMTGMYCPSRQIASLEGIEYFTALENLTCSSNQLTSLDVSKNTRLKILYCGINQLESLDVSGCTALKILGCQENRMRILNVSNCTALEILLCSYNPLSTLDLSNNTALRHLSCHDLHITSLDVSKNTELEYLWCLNNHLTTLDVSNNKKLTNLNCCRTPLTSLDVSQNTELDSLSVWGTKQYGGGLTELNLNNNPKLKLLECHLGKLTNLDLNQNPLLEYLQCQGNQLTELNLRNNINLGVLSYGLQTRELTAESGITPDGERFYYLRLDDNNDNDKSIWTHMTETNFGGVESKFVPSLVQEWTAGGAVVDGQKRVATTAGSLNPRDVKGKILLLTDVTEDPTTKTAYGTVKYKYNVNNSVTPDGDTEFTLNWSAPFYGTTPGAEASSLVLNENLIQLAQSYQLKVETPNAGEITWTSSNPQAVQVDDTGRVTALKNGTAIITATAANGDYNWCAVWSYLRGDLNEDNKVDVADMNEELNIMLNQ